MKKEILTLLLGALLHYTAAAQQKFTINYYFADSTRSDHDFYFSLIRPISQSPGLQSKPYAVEPIIADQVNGVNHTKCKFFVSDTSISVVGDVFGHEMFIMPGDEVSIYF